MTPPVTVAFVRVENAGRSQMAAAPAERTVTERGLEGRVTVVSGGTEPTDAVHGVVEPMAEVGLDVADRSPPALSRDEPLACDVVVTMGCAAEDVCPATWRGDARTRGSTTRRVGRSTRFGASAPRSSGEWTR